MRTQALWVRSLGYSPPSTWIGRSNHRMRGGSLTILVNIVCLDLWFEMCFCLSLNKLEKPGKQSCFMELMRLEYFQQNRQVSSAPQTLALWDEIILKLSQPEECVSRSPLNSSCYRFGLDVTSWEHVIWCCQQMLDRIPFVTNPKYMTWEMPSELGYLDW